jgi:Domain of unknown function (DUF4384)
MFNREVSKLLMPAAAMLLFCLAGPAAIKAQDEDESKAIKAEVFMNNRPATTRRSVARYKPAAKPAANAETAPAGTSFVQVGVTFWRFRPSTAADKTKELVEEEESGPSEWTLERIEEGTLLAPGQRVRISIESLTRPGYLYVINREQYADGTLGDPVLIYPTLKTSDANYVKAGKLVYIPSASGKFRIKPSAGPKTHVGELVTILVSAKPLVDPKQLGAKAIKLSRQQVEAWDKHWGVMAARFEMDGGVGQAMTEKEQQAGTNSSQELTQDDPVPQTVYRMAIKPADSILLSVPLKFKR